jgi:hypothetical protein
MAAQDDITISGIASENGKFNSSSQFSFISGSGFGTKTTGSPYFDNFESYSSGAVNSGLIGSLAQLNYGGTSIDTAVKHSGSKSVKHNYNSVRFPQLGMSYASPQRTAYQSCWLRFTGSITGGPTVWKFARFGNDISYQPNRFSDEHTSVANATSPDTLSGSVYTVDGEYIEYSETNDVADGSALYVSDAWMFYEVEIDGGTLGGNNGFAEVRINNVPTLRFTNFSIPDSTHTDLIKWMLTPIVGMDDATTINIQMWIDELSHDQSRCRVITTNNATYASSTNWAAQKISTWSDTSITISEPVNRGSFNAGETVYHHVFNSAGTRVHTTEARVMV